MKIDPNLFNLLLDADSQSLVNGEFKLRSPDAKVFRHEVEAHIALLKKTPGDAVDKEVVALQKLLAENKEWPIRLSAQPGFENVEADKKMWVLRTGGPDGILSQDEFNASVYEGCEATYGDQMMAANSEFADVKVILYLKKQKATASALNLTVPTYQDFLNFRRCGFANSAEAVAANEE